MFSTINKIFHNNHFISTDCNYTIPSHSHNYLTATPKITFFYKKIFFFLLHIKFYEKPVSVINKLQPLSYQFMSNITPRLPLHASQPTPKIYNATALLKHP